jgi:hypothetical protein
MKAVDGKWFKEICLEESFAAASLSPSAGS